MRLAELEKLKKKNLRERAEGAFQKADEKGPGYFMEAQFYVQELDRRHDSWISLRDLILEIVVIGLIGWEIFLGYRQDTDQAKNFTAEQKVLTQMLTSTQATADTLTSLRSTTETMNGAIQKQVELFYDVQLNVSILGADKKILLQNQGLTNVFVWGVHFGGPGNVKYFSQGNLISAAGGGYTNSIQDVYDYAIQNVAKGTNAIIPYYVFVKNEKQMPFTVKGNLVTVWQGDSLSFNAQIIQVTPGWETKP